MLRYMIIVWVMQKKSYLMKVTITKILCEQPGIYWRQYVFLFTPYFSSTLLDIMRSYSYSNAVHQCPLHNIIIYSTSKISDRRNVLGRTFLALKSLYNPYTHNLFLLSSSLLIHPQRYEFCNIRIPIGHRKRMAYMFNTQ